VCDPIASKPCLEKYCGGVDAQALGTKEEEDSKKKRKKSRAFDYQPNKPLVVKDFPQCKRW